MTDEYLIAKGWRRIGKRTNDGGWAHFWDHPDHQPDEHGAFTKTDAVNHQLRIDQGLGCDCVRIPQ